jgi:hypothetical protein
VALVSKIEDVVNELFGWKTKVKNS